MSIDTISLSLRAYSHNEQMTQVKRSIQSSVRTLEANVSVLMELGLYAIEDPDALIDPLYKQEHKKEVRAERNKIRDAITQINLVIDCLNTDQVAADEAILELKNTHGVDYSMRFPEIVLDDPE